MRLFRMDDGDFGALGVQDSGVGGAVFGLKPGLGGADSFLAGAVKADGVEAEGGFVIFDLEGHGVGL